MDRDADFERQMEIAWAIMARDSDLCAKLKDTPNQPDDGPVWKDRQIGS